MTPHPQAKRGDLGARDIDAGGVGADLGENAMVGKKIHDGGFEEVDQALDAQTGAFEIQQQVGDELSGSVVGHLPATIHLEYGNATRIQQVLPTAGLAQGVNGRVLQEPEFIGGFRVAGVREVPHGLPDRLIGAESKISNHEQAIAGRRGAGAHSGR